MTIGERIKSRRKQLGFRADDVADAIGVSRSTMFRYENGYIEKCPADVLVPIANFLHTSPAFLMGWEDDPEAVFDNPAPADELTAPERELVHRYRRAPQNIKNAVDAVLSPYGEQAANPASSEKSVG